jgi:3-phosphoshikimate 1-carboxyvinyltransferase
MRWIVKPSRLRGTIAIPPSKSHTIRALLVATLAQGTSIVRNVLTRGDGGSAIAAARSLGAAIDLSDDVATIVGAGADRDAGGDEVFTGNSGTTTTLFASAAALGKRARRFDGDASVRSRPVKTLLEALRMLGASYTCESPAGDVPFTIRGPLAGGPATVNGISSQFVSSLLFACPLLPRNSEITVVNPHEKPYIALTLWWLDRMGISCAASADYTKFQVPGKQRYAPLDCTVPADFSSATFAAVAAAVTGSLLELAGLDFSDPQGDKAVFEHLAAAGCAIEKNRNSVTVSSPAPLQGRMFDLNATPDALPALAVLGCRARGETHLVNVAQARIKETDRIAVMCTELSRMGARIAEERDGLIVRNGPLHGCAVNGHNDHRVVMALALAGMIAEGETVIETAESADVTYPTFVADFRKLGAEIRVTD